VFPKFASGSDLKPLPDVACRGGPLNTSKE